MRPTREELWDGDIRAMRQEIPPAQVMVDILRCGREMLDEILFELHHQGMQRLVILAMAKCLYAHELPIYEILDARLQCLISRLRRLPYHPQ